MHTSNQNYQQNLCNTKMFSEQYNMERLLEENHVVFLTEEEFEKMIKQKNPNITEEEIMNLIRDDTK